MNRTQKLTRFAADISEQRLATPVALLRGATTRFLEHHGWTRTTSGPTDLGFGYSRDTDAEPADVAVPEGVVLIPLTGRTRQGVIA